MTDVEEIINTINSYVYLYDKHQEDAAEKLANFFLEDASFTNDFVGCITGRSEIQEALKEQLALDFTKAAVSIPCGHTVISRTADNAKVSSYTVFYWHCMPVMITQWEDEMVKCADQQWKFKSRISTDVQKNLEALGEMQLKGKKSYHGS